MPAQIIALYGEPDDAEAFQRYYRETHIPLAKQLPGLIRYELSRGAISDFGGGSPYFMVATLTFSAKKDIHAAMVSEIGEAVASDLKNFATGGVTVLIMESEEV